MTTTTPNPTTPPEIVERVKQIHREGLRMQLERDPITAARAAQEAGKSLAYYVLWQCSWRGIDPAPYLAEIGVETVGAEPITCAVHGSTHGEVLVHHELTECVQPVAAANGALLGWDAGRVDSDAPTGSMACA